MENSIMVEENHHCGDSNLLPKSVGSSIRINSISIDLVGANDEIDAEKCEHFSIRGYVSEIRKRDWKRCSPFALDGNHDKLEEQTCMLPPLYVPKFRWWHCQNCLQEIGDEGTANCSDIQQGPTPNAVEGRTVDANMAAILNKSDCHPSSCSGKKKKKAEVSNISLIGHDIGSDENVNKELPLLTNAAALVISSTMLERHHTDDIVLSKKDCNGSVESSKAGSESHEVSGTERMVENSMEKFQTGNKTFMTDQSEELMIVFGSSEVAGVVDEVPDMVKCHTSEHPSLELGECNNASFGSAEILVRNRFKDHHHDNAGGMHRRKARKVRLLTELLGKSGDANTTNMSTEDSPSNVFSDALAGVDMLSAPQGQVAIQGIVTRDGQNKKRKLSQDEEWLPREMNSPNNVYKKDGTLNADEETTGAARSSDSEDNAFSGFGLQTGIKRHWTNNHGVDRIPIKCKKKNKKGQIVDESLALTLSRESLQKDIKKKTDDSSKGNATDSVLLKSAATAFTGRGLVPCSVHAQKTERKSSLSQKKSKMTPVDDEQAALIPWNNGMLGLSTITSKDIEVLQSKPLAVPCQTTQDASPEKGLDLSINSFLASQRYDKIYIPQLKDELASPLPWQDDTCKGDLVMRKDLKTDCVRDFGFLSKSEPVACVQKGVQFDLNSKRTTKRMPSLNEKQKYTPAVEVGSCSLMQQMDTCGGSSNGKTFEIQEHSAVTRKHSNKRAKKMPDQLVLDDIPMEIVELMAKNQYERCLPDAENEKQSLQAANKDRNAQIMDLNKVYGNEKFDLLQEETARKPKPRAKTGRNSEITRGENVLTAKQKSVDCFSHADRNHYNMSQLGQPYAPAGIAAFPQNRENPSSAVHYSATSSSGQSSAHNCQWVGNMVVQRSPPTTFSALTACNMLQSVPQQCKEADHLWSSMIPNHMSFAYSMPQKCMDQSTRIDLSCSTSNLLKGNGNGNNDSNFLNLNVTNPEMHTRKFDSKTFSRTHAESRFGRKHTGVGSLDLYSNETIPAMHLLSLMDAGLQSGTPIDLNGTPKSLKRPSFHHDHHSKEFSGMPYGGYKTTNTLKHPPFDCYGENSLSENSYESFSAIPTVGASAFSFQHDKSLNKAADYTAQVSWKTREKEMRKDSNSPAQNRGCRSQESLFANGDLGKNLGSIPVPSNKKLVLGTPDSMLLPLKFRAMKSAMKEKLGPQSTDGTVWPLKISSVPEICNVNRNPADFTLIEAGNEYMIRGQGLKFRKPAGSGSRSGLFKLEGKKRRKKLTSAKENS